MSSHNKDYYNFLESGLNFLHTIFDVSAFEAPVITVLDAIDVQIWGYLLTSWARVTMPSGAEGGGEDNGFRMESFLNLFQTCWGNWGLEEACISSTSGNP